MTGRRYFARNLVRASSFSDEYEEILAYAVLQGYTLPSGGQNIINNNKISYLKSEGIWDQLDLLYVFNQESGLSDFCKINWVNPGSFTLYQNTPANVPTHIANTGFKGGGLKHFMTGFTPSVNAINLSRTNAALFSKWFDVPNTFSQQFNAFGARNSNNQAQIWMADFNASIILPRLFISNTGSRASNSNIHYLFIRTSIDFRGYYDNTLTITNSDGVNVGMTSKELVLLGFNENGTISGSIESGGLKYLGLGAGSVIESKRSELLQIMNETY
jgi:hypothetical protein